MENHTNGTNGKALTVSRTSLVPAPVEVAPARPNIERIYKLASDVINYETKRDEAMTELRELVVHMDESDTTRLLLTMIKQPNLASSSLATLPVLDTARTIVPPAPPSFPKEPTLTDDFKDRIMALMGDGRERKAEAIIKALKAKKQKSTVYLALGQLVGEGLLIKPAFAHYRKRGS